MFNLYYLNLIYTFKYTIKFKETTCFNRHKNNRTMNKKRLIKIYINTHKLILIKKRI